MTQPAAQPITPSPRLPKQRLLDLFRAIAGVEVVWDTGRRPLLGTQPGTEPAWVLIGLQSWIELGTDEQRYYYDPSTGANAVHKVGQRAFTVPVQAFSVEADTEAFDICERIRYRLRSEQARAIMVPTLALRDFQSVMQPPPITSPSGRVVLRATMDVRMLCVVGSDETNPDTSNFIESVNLPTPTVGTTAPTVAIPPKGVLIP